MGDHVDGVKHIAQQYNFGIGEHVADGGDGVVAPEPPVRVEP